MHCTTRKAFRSKTKSGAVWQRTAWVGFGLGFLMAKGSFFVFFVGFLSAKRLFFLLGFLSAKRVFFCFFVLLVFWGGAKLGCF